jgi:hypothetical protein
VKELEARLARWVVAGLVTEEQARAILATERSAEDAPEDAPEPEPSLVATALGYLGASVALVGGIVAASRRWSEMGTGSRLALAGGATLLLLAGGWVARRRDHPALRSLDGFLWFLAAGGAAFTAGLAGHELLDLETRTVFLLAGLATVASGFSLWRIRPGPLQEIAVVVGLALFVESLLLHLPGPPNELHGLPLWGLGTIWALLAWGGILPERRSSFALAGVALLLGAQILSFGWRGVGLALGIGTGVALLAASVGLRSMLPLGFGAAGVLLFLPQIVFEYLGDSLGAPLALLVCGVGLLGAAFLAARLRGTVREGPRPEGDGDRGSRTRGRATALAAGTALAVGAFVWAFGVAPLPDYPSLADRPDPSIPGRIAFLRWGAQPPCLYVVPARGGEPRRLRCAQSRGDDTDWLGGPVGWTREGLVVVQAFGPSGPRAIVLDAETGRTLERIGVEEPLFARSLPPDGSVRADGVRLLVRSSGRTATVGIAPPDGRPIEVARVSGPPGFAFGEALWSPNGEWILVRDSNQNLLILPAREGTRPRLLAERVSGPLGWHIPGVVAGTVDLDSLRAAAR